MQAHGEITLWTQVIAFAIQDSVNPKTVRDTPKLEQKREMLKKQAHSWLFDTNSDFNYICTLLGLDKSWVRAQAEKAVRDKESLVRQYRTNA